MTAFVHMNSQELKNLYTPQEIDEEITPYVNEAGFSIVRKYPKSTPYFKDDRRMFIAFAITKSGLLFSVNTTTPQIEAEEKRYVITDGDQYKSKVTNFHSDNTEELIFDEDIKKIIHQPTGKAFTLNQFIDILMSNHLTDRHFWRRKLHKIDAILLKFLFWLSDKHYDKIRASIDQYHFRRNNKPAVEDERNVDPFFRYFRISKNMIFFFLLSASIIIVLSFLWPIVMPLKKLWIFGEFSLSNPVLVLFVFLFLLIVEMLSLKLDRKINEFFAKDSMDQKINFIDRLHNYQYQFRFQLKLNK